MIGLRLTLFLALLVVPLACEDGAAGVGEAEGRALCRESCQKAEMCFGAVSDLDGCLDACDNGSSNDTDSSCTPEEEDAIASHFRGCNAGSCDNYLACIASSPGCSG